MTSNVSDQDSGEVALQKALDRSTRDFSILDPFPRSWSKWPTFSLNDYLPVEERVRIALTLSMRSVSLGTSEKMRWARGFSYKGVACVVALQKFGLRLYVAKEGFTNDRFTSVASDPVSRDESRALLIDSLVTDLKKAVKIVERKLLIPLFAKERERGAIVIRNDYNAIRQMYLYFRERAENWEELEAAVRVETVSDSAEILEFSPAEIFRPILEEQIRLRKKGYYEVAATLVFFSLLEHVLVLLYPLTKVETEFATNHFLGLDIWEKWSVVLGKSRQSLRLKDKAFKVADKYRNFYAHGGIAKKSQSSYVHIPGVGSLTDPNFGDMRQPIFPFVEPELKQSNVIDVLFPFFDEVEKWLKEGESRFGMNYVEEGFDVPFDPEFRSFFLSQTEDVGQFDIWLTERSLALDRFLNFEP